MLPVCESRLSSPRQSVRVPVHVPGCPSRPVFLSRTKRSVSPEGTSTLNRRTVRPGIEIGNQVSSGSGHEFGLQEVHSPCHMLGAAQATRAVTAHVPSWAQQAPVGCGQGFGVQVVLAPCQVLGAAQTTWVVTVQTPEVGSQQPPVGCAHGFGVQVVFAPCQVIGAAQAA